MNYDAFSPVEEGAMLQSIENWILGNFDIENYSIKVAILVEMRGKSSSDDFLF